MKNLPLNSYVFRELELDYREWLALLGYAENTVYNMPLHMHEFFHWLVEIPVMLTPLRRLFR